MEVDRTGAFRASPTYWVWGWDAMVHAGPLAMTGRAEEVKRMLEFFERVADPKKGILHSYNETFRYSGDGSTGPGGSLVLPPHVQLFYVVLLHDYWCLTGDDALRDRLLPFARKLVERALAVPVKGEGLCREYGFFPDNPYAVDQRHDDISLINNAIYYQGLCAYNALAGGLDAECEAVRRELVAKLWDPKEGYWSDAWDVSTGARRAHYPLYGLFAVSPFGLEAWPCGMSAAADYMKSRFFLGDRLAMFSPGTQSHLADGNQLGAYYPVADRTYWNVMNAASRVDALADLRHILTSHWKVMTYPEGQCADVVNGDPSDYSDELGNKQFFAAKSWLCDALELNLGLRWSTKGLSFHAIGDGRPFAVSNLSLRGGKLAIRRTGSGTCAKYILNGRPLEGAFLPWTALTGDDRVDIVCFAEDDLVKWVDPLIGTAGEGNTIPGSAYPFGMVQPGPDSGTGTNCGGYKHGDGTIRGISQTHLNGTGCAGMGDILLMPYTGETDGVDFSSPFSGQTCSPDRYSVSFDRFGTRAESTCSEHVSWLRFSYPEGASRKVFLDCASTLRMPWRAKNGPAVPESSFALSDDRMEVSGSRTVVGWTTYTLHYVVRFDSPWTEARRQPSNAAEARGDRFELAFAPGRPLVARVALSTVSVEGARRNLDAESAGMDFESVVAANRAAWNGLLSRAVVEEGSDEQKASWYTALYRLCIQPNNIADVDGSYRGDDGRVARAKCGRYYSTLSLWDTFRAAHPLYTLVVPERVDGFVETMVLHGEAHGHLPVWPLWGRESHDMIGVHSIPVLVDAWAKGFRPVSGERILELAVKSMTTCDEEWNELAWNITFRRAHPRACREVDDDMRRGMERARMEHNLGERLHSVRAGSVRQIPRPPRQCIPHPRARIRLVVHIAPRRASRRRTRQTRRGEVGGKLAQRFRRVRRIRAPARAEDVRRTLSRAVRSARSARSGRVLERLHRGEQLGVHVACDAGSGRSCRGDGRTRQSAREAGRVLLHASACRRKPRRRRGGGGRKRPPRADRAVLARQRAVAPRHLPLFAARTPRPRGEARARSLREGIPGEAGRAVRKRRLRADERVVRLQRDGVLSVQPLRRRLRPRRGADPARQACASGREDACGLR